MVRHASGYRSAAYNPAREQKSEATWRYNFRVKATLGSSSLPELSPMPMGPPAPLLAKEEFGGKSDLAGETGRRSRPKARDVGAGVWRPSKDLAKLAAAPRRN